MNTSSQRALAWALLYSLVGMGAILLSRVVYPSVRYEDASAFRGFLIPLAAVFLLVGLRGKHIHPGHGRIFRAFRYGLPLFVGAILLFAFNFIQLEKVSFQGRAAFFFGVNAILTGLFEELLCRGLIQGELKEGFASDRKGVIRAIVTASALFALMHILNYFQTGRPVETLSQVGYTFALGVMLGVAYELSGSLAGVVLLHAFFNFMAGGVHVFSALPLTQEATTDLPLVGLMIQWGILFPGMIGALLSLRRQKRREGKHLG